MMETHLEHNHKILVVDLPQTLDHAAATPLRRTLQKKIVSGWKLVLNWKRLETIDCFGLDALLVITEKALKANSGIKLAQVSPNMRIVLEITRACRFFEIFDTVEAAIADFQQEAE